MASDERLFSTALVYSGKAMADNIPMINTTTKSSISVKTAYFAFSGAFFRQGSFLIDFFS